MPRFYFDLENGLGLTCDEEGKELPDLESAKKEAIAQARPIIAEHVLDGCLDLTGRILIRLGSKKVLEVPFYSAVEIRQPGSGG